MFSRRWPPLLQILSLAFGAAGLLFGVVTHCTNVSIHRIDAVILSYVEFDTELVDTQSEHTVELRVLFDGNPATELKQLVLEIRNAGNRVLRENDNPLLYLQFPTSARILALDIAEKPDPHMQFDANPNLALNRVELTLGLLKPGESVAMSVFVDGELPFPYFTFEGRSVA